MQVATGGKTQCKVEVQAADARQRGVERRVLEKPPLSSAVGKVPTRSRSLNWFVINPWKNDDEVMNI